MARLSGTRTRCSSFEQLAEIRPGLLTHRRPPSAAVGSTDACRSLDMGTKAGTIAEFEVVDGRKRVTLSP